MNLVYVNFRCLYKTFLFSRWTSSIKHYYFPSIIFFNMFKPEEDVNLPSIWKPFYKPKFLRQKLYFFSLDKMVHLKFNSKSMSIKIVTNIMGSLIEKKRAVLRRRPTEEIDSNPGMNFPGAFFFIFEMHFNPTNSAQTFFTRSILKISFFSLNFLRIPEIHIYLIENDSPIESENP